MTRKDYEAIAAVCRNTNHELRRQALNASSEYLDGGVDGACLLTIRLADMLADDNPRFDRERFMAAANPARLSGRG